MATVEQQVRAASDGIERNIEMITSDRGFLSQNVMKYLRDLVEGLIVWAYTNRPDEVYDYDGQFKPAKGFVGKSAKFNRLTRFHHLLQASTSHYALEGDPSERLMLKYYEYLIRTRDIARDELGVTILGNLEKFPTNQDPSLRDYYEKIAARIDLAQKSPLPDKRERYYITHTRPFVVDGRIYYEVTFLLAHNKTSKFDRIIGFTDIDLSDKYSANLRLSSDHIDVLDQTMPILIIRDWEVSIRPCELDNFARLFGLHTRIQSGQAEYRSLMQYLTDTRSNLLELMDMSDEDYLQVRSWVTRTSQRSPEIFLTLDRARKLIRADSPGARLLRYVMLRMNNRVLKAQYEAEKNSTLSGLRVSRSCRPFDTMPFCSSPKGHNATFYDLTESISAAGREHELLARRIRNNVEQHGMIYTPDGTLEGFEHLDALIQIYNEQLPPTVRHKPREMVHESGHVFISGYESDTAEIIETLQGVAGEGIDNYSEDAEQWLNNNASLQDGDPSKVDDPDKIQALRTLFENSKVALVYGAAGSGKSTMVNHIANYFADDEKLFLAHTNPAVENLKRRVDATNASFSTIARHLNGSSSTTQRFGLLVIDECSTVSNANILEVLKKTRFDLLVLVGDVYQIESIEFGNWFRAIRSYLPPESVFELTSPYRTTDGNLQMLWDRVRSLDDKIEESLAKNGYSKVLGESLFQRSSDDEIVLCLNYDGLYGINNVNRFMQASNSNPSVTFGEAVYKVGDPILFNDADRFRGVIHNNMKGTIVAIDRQLGSITFNIDLHQEIEAANLWNAELRMAPGSKTIVQFDVQERNNTDDDDDSFNSIVPFQVAYAVSIHKAQGLEYDSVKVVITDANEMTITHSIFYTAITRARNQLAVFWTPETQKRILDRLEVKDNIKDEHLMRMRRGVKPIVKREKLSKTRMAP